MLVVLHSYLPNNIQLKPSFRSQRKTEGNQLVTSLGRYMSSSVLETQYVECALGKGLTHHVTKILVISATRVAAAWDAKPQDKFPARDK